MKYFYQFAILLLFVLTIVSEVKINSFKKSLSEFKNENKVLQNDSENYLNSLFNYSINHPDSLISILTSDTISLSTIRHPTLFYFFSPNDCMSCVDENIFTIINLAKINVSINIYIVSTIDKMQYLSSFSKTQKIKTLFFAYVIGELGIPASNYFIVFENGKVSNSYYPLKNQFESTERYLQNAMKIRKDVSLENGK